MTHYRGNAGQVLRPRGERGAALVVGLLLLVVLTLLAISGMTTATLELQMAGNEQYQERAFQAADAAIERAMQGGVYNTTVTLGDYTPGATVNDPPIPTRGDGIDGCVSEVADDGTRSDSGDCYEYFMRFDQQTGSTPVPGGGYSLGTGFEAYHFVVDSFGTSSRGAASDHQQSFYIIGPGGT
jgi:type IV pilus assembly protein PilX